MMKTYIKNATIFYLLSRNALKITLQGRMGVIFFLLGKIIRVLFIFAFLALVFNRTRLVKGYNFEQILVFFLTFNIIDTLGQILYRQVYRFRPLVVSGGFDMVLLKPIHPFIRILLGGVDFLDLLLVIPYFFVTFFIFAKMEISSFHMFLYLLLIMNSMVMVTGFHISILALGIATTEVDHTIMIYRDLSAMGRFPMDIYKEPVSGFFTYIIPVSLMMNVPAQAILGLATPWFILFSLLISLGLLCLSLLFWDYALKRYQSWGG